MVNRIKNKTKTGVIFQIPGLLQEQQQSLLLINTTINTASRRFSLVMVIGAPGVVNVNHLAQVGSNSHFHHQSLSVD